MWKKLLIWGICALGVFLASPNMFYTKVEQSNDAYADIEMKGATPERIATAEQRHTR